jgi:hypothetical protein
MSKSLTTSPKTALAIPAEVSRDFDHARKIQNKLKGCLIGTAAMMALWGFEIERLQKKWGDGRGGDRRSSGFKTRKRAGFEIPTWEALLKAELGISTDTAERYKILAKNAKKRSATLAELEDKLLTIPFEQLPPKLQEKAIEATNGVMDGRSAAEAARDFGIARKEKGSFSKQHKGGNSTARKTTPEEDAQDVFGHLLRTIGDVMDPWHTFELRLYALPLDTTEEEYEAGQISLSDLKQALASLQTHVDKAIERTAKHARSSNLTDSKARTKEAAAKARAEATASRS